MSRRLSKDLLGGWPPLNGEVADGVGDRQGSVSDDEFDFVSLLKDALGFLVGAGSLCIVLELLKLALELVDADVD